MNNGIEAVHRLVTVVSLLAPVALFANPTFEGDWMLDVRPDGGAALRGVLQIESEGDGWVAFVEGGPAPLQIDGRSISVDIDSRDIRGFVFILRLKGEMTDSGLNGSFDVVADAPVSFAPGEWSAVRHSESPRPSDPDPVDLSGQWRPLPGVDFRKYTMHLTPEAAEWHAGYLMHYDQPNVRCVSPGIVAMVAWGGYPFEILESDQRLTFLYEFDGEVRRIYMDGREAANFQPHSNMGYSTARWEGANLVIETTHLARNVRDFGGEPISEQARMEEVYSLSDDGQTLRAVITLHDPDNYERPPVRRRAWRRDAEGEIFPYECDPDSFFRQMYNEDLLDMYFERSKRRF